MHTFIIAATSIDGFIAEKIDQISTDWTSKADKHFFRDRTKQAGVMVMGRKTFETVGRPLPGRINIVVSSQLSAIGSESSNFVIKPLAELLNDPNRKELISNPPSVIYQTQLTPTELVQQLEEAGASELAICGGASIYRQFVEAGVVDTLYISVEPVIFGGGVKLFGEGTLESKKWSLVSSEKLGEDGTVLLEYSQ